MIVSHIIYACGGGGGDHSLHQALLRDLAAQRGRAAMHIRKSVREIQQDCAGFEDNAARSTNTAGGGSIRLETCNAKPQEPCLDHMIAYAKMATDR